MKIKIAFDKEKVLSLGYDYKKIEKMLIDAYESKGLMVSVTGENLSFEGMGNPDDYTYLIKLSSLLLEKEWFKSTAKFLVFFKDNGEAEDLLAKAKGENPNPEYLLDKEQPGKPKKIRRQLVLEIDENKLSECYPNGKQKAYAEIESYMNEYFFKQNNSLMFVSDDCITQRDMDAVIKGMVLKMNWLAECVTNAYTTDYYDMETMIHVLVAEDEDLFEL